MRKLMIVLFVLTLFTLCVLGTATAENVSDLLARAKQYGEEGNYALELETYLQAADAGNAEAMLQLGYIYYGYGRRPYQDEEEAKKWMMKAIEAGNGQAACEIGGFYRDNKKGFELNYEKALEYFQKAGELGYGFGYVAIAKMYADGTGVEADIHKAIDWIILGMQTSPSSAVTLREWLEKGRIPEEDIPRIIEALEVTASTECVGRNASIRTLYTMYQDGYGVEKNREIAARWKELLNQSKK